MAMPQRDDTIEAIYLQGRVLFIKSAVFGIILTYVNDGITTVAMTKTAFNQTCSNGLSLFRKRCCRFDFGIILCKKQSIKEKPFYGFR